MADAVRNMLPDRQPDLTRRALFDGLPFSGAAVTVQMPFHSATQADCTPMRTGAEHFDRPVLTLPSVRATRARKRTAGAAPRDFSGVVPTGKDSTDWATGARSADLAPGYMVAAIAPQILPSAVFGMIAMQRLRSGIEVGFMSAFGRITTLAHATHQREGCMA